LGDGDDDQGDAQRQPVVSSTGDAAGRGACRVFGSVVSVLVGVVSSRVLCCGAVAAAG
jgi:hypothetical protein